MQLITKKTLVNVLKTTILENEGIIYVGGTEPTPIINKKPKKHHAHHKHFTRGQIAGIAVGSSLGLMLFSALGFIGYRRYKFK